jgi:1-acyl-sn-glycerol-3-phosphate acyltransferase
MLSAAAHLVRPLLGRLTVTRDDGAEVPPGSIVAPNHTSLADPAVVLAALHRLGVRPVIMATAGLWRIPLLGAVLVHGGHIPVHRRTARASDALRPAAEVLERGGVVLMYGEGGIPDRPGAAEFEPERFRTGIARLALETGAPVVPLGQTGARSLSSGPAVKQLAGVLTAPVRRPRLHVHLGTPVRLEGSLAEATDRAHTAVTAAWRTAVRLSGAPVGDPRGRVPGTRRAGSAGEPAGR